MKPNNERSVQIVLGDKLKDFRKFVRNAREDKLGYNKRQLLAVYLRYKYLSKDEEHIKKMGIVELSNRMGISTKEAQSLLKSISCNPYGQPPEVSLAECDFPNQYNKFKEEE